MSDISVTATSVVLDSGTKTTGIAGVAITAGQAIRVDADDSGKIKLSDSDAAGTAQCDGIALNGAAVGQPVSYAQENAVVSIGGTTTVGEIYCVSSAAGGLCPHADVVSTKRVTVVGFSNASGKITVKPINTGVALA